MNVEISQVILIACGIGLVAICIILFINELRCRRKEKELFDQSHEATDEAARITVCTTTNVSSPHGLKVVASAGPPKDPLPESHDQIRVIERSEKQRKYKCSHSGPKTFKLDVYGSRTKPFEQKDECSDCVLARYRKHVIRCALCGLDIVPGDGVALYSPGPETHPEYATKIGDSVIGCLRWDCCPSGGFFAGNWSEEGFKPRFGGEVTAAESLMFPTAKT